MSLWSMCSNSRLKSGIMRGIECNSLLMQMQIYDSKITQTARKFSRTHIALKDYYSALGVTKIATQQDIKNAYYRLSKIHHPDKNKGCENSAELFRIATEAYEVLGNYRTRRLYDKGNFEFIPTLKVCIIDIILMDSRCWHKVEKIRPGGRSGTDR